MEYMFYKPEWLEILREQERALRVNTMPASECLKLGLIMERLAREVYKKGIAIRIITNGQVTFSHLMEGTDLNNIWWMDKKLNTSRVTGTSSILALVECAMGIRPLEPEFENEGNYVLCGGCFPLRTESGKLLGWMQCSALPHQNDHQLLVDALSEYTGIKVPRIED